MRALDWKLPTGTAWEWFVATPGAIVLIIIIGLLFRWFVSRAISRLVTRATSGRSLGPLTARAVNLFADINPAAAARRHQRASTMGSNAGFSAVPPPSHCLASSDSSTAAVLPFICEPLPLS